MCGMNLAFDRTLIGAAMYFGLMGHGQPIGRYDDMWAGWCAKVSAGPLMSIRTRTFRWTRTQERTERLPLQMIL